MATTNIDSTRNFIDLDLNFAIHPIRKDINTHKAEYAVINSVKNLILTNHFERPFQPEVGSNIRRLLFENVDDVVRFKMWLPANIKIVKQTDAKKLYADYRKNVADRKQKLAQVKSAIKSVVDQA